MDNHDKIFNKIKEASQKAERQDFSSKDKVWSRVEEKLDTKVLKKETKLWKKLAVAASLLFIFSVGYQFFKDEKKLIIPQNELVIIDTTKTILPKTETQNAIVSTDEPNSNIKKNADAILEKQILTQSPVAVNDDVSKEKETAKDIENSTLSGSKSYNNVASTNSNSGWIQNRKFESRGVTQQQADNTTLDTEAKSEEIVTQKKQNPIVVIDDKVSKKGLSNLADDQIESIVELKDPLYIINKVYYSEEELFGENPTSPYFPLNKQNIETISILQPEKAISIYGKKGEKGVVIITTKDGEPAQKKRN